MRYFVFVAVKYRLEYLLKQNRSLLLTDILLLNDSIKKFSASSHFLNEINIIFFFVDFKELDDVRMVKSFECRDFIDESFVLLNLGSRNLLNRPNLSSEIMDAFVHDSVSSFSEFGIKCVVVFYLRLFVEDEGVLI